MTRRHCRLTMGVLRHVKVTSVIRHPILQGWKQVDVGSKTVSPTDCGSSTPINHWMRQDNIMSLLVIIYYQYYNRYYSVINQIKVKLWLTTCCPQNCWNRFWDLSSVFVSNFFWDIKMVSSSTTMFVTNVVHEFCWSSSSKRCHQFQII